MRRCNGSTLRAYWKTNFRNQLNRPHTDFKALAVVGGAMFARTETLSIPGSMPLWFNWTPKYGTAADPKTHFSGFNLKLALIILSIAAARAGTCCAWSLVNTNVSSRYVRID